jgi:hypothetical protein
MPFPNIDGPWFSGGNPALPCAVFQKEQLLILLNEKGEIATGKFLSYQQFITLTSPGGWPAGLVGDLDPGLRTIAWRNGTMWSR